jgi:voltage-gated potassium channel
MFFALARILLPGRRLLLALSMLASVLAFGTIGYMALADLGFVDALYQTVTTLSTVGFREVKPFDREEKLFTVFLILVGVGTVLYTLTLLVQELLESDVRSRLYRRRMKMEIAELKDHYIVCGFGRVGTEIARELREQGVEFVVIDANPDEVERATQFGYHVVHGEASDEKTLNEAGIRNARCLFAASDSDSGNTFITLTAKSMNPGCFVVARVAYPYNQEKLRLAGADRVLSLYTLGGRRMVLSALQPLAADFMDTLAAGRHGDLVLAEFEVSRETGLVGRTCRDLFERAPQATLLGLRHEDGEVVVGPRNTEELRDGDILIVLAEEPELARLSAPAPRAEEPEAASA